jgi:hypothetical protein
MNESYRISTAGAGVKWLVDGCEMNNEISLVTMIRKPWAALEAVGDQSDYVTAISTNILSTATVIKKALAGQKYYRSFCDKFAE